MFTGRYFELKVTIMLDEDVLLENINEKLSKLISHAMLFDDDLKEYHENRQMKSFCYNFPTPIEPTQVYQKQTLYLFHIRTISFEFATKLRNCLLNKRDNKIKVFACDLVPYQWNNVTHIKTLSPMIITMPDGTNWTKEKGLTFVDNALHINALKKYRLYVGELEEREEGFIEEIELLNSKAWSIKFKNGILLANKFSMMLKQDDYSQKLAFTLFACGNEKSSLGSGYCIVDKRR